MIYAALESDLEHPRLGTTILQQGNSGWRPPQAAQLELQATKSPLILTMAIFLKSTGRDTWLATLCLRLLHMAIVGLRRLLTACLAACEVRTHTFRAVGAFPSFSSAHLALGA